MVHKQLSLLESARARHPGLSDARHVQEIAARVLADLAEKPPVDLNVVASYLGVSKIRRVPLEMSGLITPTDEQMVMLLNKDDSPRRQRFTGFHEIGHLFQPGYWLVTSYRCAPLASPTRPPVLDTEALSDIAAAALMFPDNHFSADVRDTPFSITAVTDLAENYNASVHATVCNFQRYWPEPTMTVILEPGLRKAERKDASAQRRLRVVSAFATGAGWPYIPVNKSASNDGLLNRALSGEVIDAKADLNELDITFDRRLELTARAFPYRAGNETRERVIAIYRQTSTKQERQESQVATSV